MVKSTLLYASMNQLVLEKKKKKHVHRLDGSLDRQMHIFTLLAPHKIVELAYDPINIVYGLVHNQHFVFSKFGLLDERIRI